MTILPVKPPTAWNQAINNGEIYSHCQLPGCLVRLTKSQIKFCSSACGIEALNQRIGLRTFLTRTTKESPQ